MPIGSDAMHIEKMMALESAIKSCGRSPKFPIYTQGAPKFELQEFMLQIKRAELVIADLSFGRPSCYYELGVVEGIGKKVHLLAIENTEIHQCSGRREVHFYRDIPDLIRIVVRLLGD